uniref:RNA-directed DNA polymerase, eukaryota n=1 Tax=Tanacetum cinerariifolium TaxID=118510 RepID=A0A6L2NEL5_TANCI|nr:RNA-directed DNA polymerase, eukaryota [Tanacetum cinerariifolium]
MEKEAKINAAVCILNEPGSSEKTWNHQSKPIDNPFVKDVEKSATSFYVTNFPNSLDAKNLWKEFQPIGRMVDAYIANKRSKQGKRFGFVKFLGVHNEVDFEKSLSNVWIESYHVFVSVAKYQRNPKSDLISLKKPYFENLQPKTSHGRPIFNSNCTAEFFSKQSYASVAHGETRPRVNLQTNVDNIKNIQLGEDDLIKVEDTSTVVLVKVKEIDTISNMYHVCQIEGFLDVKIHYVGGLWMWIQFTSAKSCEANLSIHISNDLESNDSDDDRDFEEHRSINEKVDPKETFDDFVKHTVEDKDVIKASAQGYQSDDSTPPDIKKDVAINDEATPRVVNVGVFSSSDTNKECSRSSNSSRSGKCSTSFGKYKRKELKGFVFFDVMNRMIEAGGALGFDVKGCKKSLRQMINGIARERSGGLVTIWDPNFFVKKRLRCGDNYIIVEGKWKNSTEEFFIINVYDPQHQPYKSILWSFLHNFILNHSGKVILPDDLNEVRSESERSQSGNNVTTDNNVEGVSESSCMHNNDLIYDNNHNNIMLDNYKILSKDPFNLYDILNKRNDSGDDLKYPPGFTPSVINVEEVNKRKGATSNEVNEHVNSNSNKLEESIPKGKLSLNNCVCSKKVHTGDSMLQLMDEFYKMMNELVRNQCDVTNHQVNVQFLLQLQPEWQRPQQAATKNRGKTIINSPPPTYDQEPEMVAEDDALSKEKEIDKLMALISLSFKKIYKPTNNNLNTSSNTIRENQDNTLRINRGTGYDNQMAVNVAGARENIDSHVVQKSRIHFYNYKEYWHVAIECQKLKRANDVAYHKEKMILCKQEEAGFQLNAEQADRRDDTNDKPEDQDLKAHYLYMAQIQVVTPNAVENSGPIFDVEPLQNVQNDNDNYNVFANDSEHPKQPESVNDTYPDEKDEDEDLAKEHDLLASLVEKLKSEINESKERNKLLDSSNKTLVDKLKREIEDFKNKNKCLESLNNHFKEANTKLVKNNQLMFIDLKKFQAKLDRYHDVDYASKLVEIVLFIVDSGCSKHMTGNLKLLSNFVEKFICTVKFKNDQIASILGYGDLYDIVTGLPKLKFVKDYICSSCELGKAKLVSKSSVITAADAPNERQQQNTTPSTSTTVAADTPPLNIQTTTKTTNQAPTQAASVTAIENINLAKSLKENAQVDEDKFINIFSTPYSKDTGFKLSTFSDLDHVGCLDSSKSTSVGIQFLGGDKLVSWSSKKRDYTSISTVKAEYVSLSACCAQVLWIRTQLTDYGFHFDKIPM